MNMKYDYYRVDNTYNNGQIISLDWQMPLMKIL